jgi:Flp pilus assembly protein TadB
MEGASVIGLIAVMGAFLSGGFLLYFLMPKRQADLRSLMNSGTAAYSPSASPLSSRGIEEDFEKAKALAKKKAKKKEPVTLAERYFHAGIFSEQERKQFQQIRVLAPIVLPLVMGIVIATVSTTYALYAAVLGLLIGIQLPFSMLDRRARQRAEDILFYLPLVVEQIVIGVSSSLDVGPCLQRVVQMADERDSHNPVTELLKHAQAYAKSGTSMSDALMEIGRLSGNNELKHTFMSLSQVSKHGGEITKQLQELADAVAAQRETKIEAKIKRLELEATGPVGLVFMGFMLIFTVGFIIQLMEAFAKT